MSGRRSSVSSRERMRELPKPYLPGQQIVELEADAVERRLPPVVVRHHEAEIVHQVRRVAQQQAAFLQRFHHQRDVALLQIAHAAVHQLGAAAGGAFAEIALLEQRARRSRARQHRRRRPRRWRRRRSRSCPTGPGAPAGGVYISVRVMVFQLRSWRRSTMSPAVHSSVALRRKIRLMVRFAALSLAVIGCGASSAAGNGTDSVALEANIPYNSSGTRLEFVSEGSGPGTAAGSDHVPRQADGSAARRKP